MEKAVFLSDAVRKKDWINAVRTADKEQVKFLHPCMALCGKWATCESKDGCPENLPILDAVWRGKCIAINAWA